MDYTCIFLGMFFIAAGILFAFGKGHIHISAWKNMSQDEKNKIKIKPLVRNIGTVIMTSGVIFLMKGLWTEFSKSWFVYSIVTWLILAGLDVCYISKSKRYRNK